MKVFKGLFLLGILSQELRPGSVHFIHPLVSMPTLVSHKAQVLCIPYGALQQPVTESMTEQCISFH